MKQDTLFYHLFLTHSEQSLRWLAIENPDAYNFKAIEVKEKAYRIDVVFLPKEDQPDLPIIFVEVQFQPDIDLFSRMVGEIVIYLTQHKPNRLWQAIMIYPNQSVARAPRLEFSPFTALKQFKNLFLDELLQQPKPEYAILNLILCPEPETRAIVKNIVENYQDLNKELVDLIETILIYKLPNISTEDIKAMLAINEVRLQDTRFYQEVAQISRAEILIRQLTKRFGTLSANNLTRLQSANIEQLDSWAEKIFDANSLEELFN